MAVLAARIWPSWRRTSLQPKGSRLDSPRTRPKLGTDFRRRGFAGNRAPISGPASWRSEPNFRRTAGQAGADITLCVSARDVNITRHRPCVHMQETSVSHSIMDFCCVWNIYAASEFFQQNIFLDKTISNIIDYNLNLKKVLTLVG